MHAQCYNPRIPRILLLPSCGQRGFFLAVIFLAMLAPRCSAQEWDTPARQFAEKILARAQSRSGLTLTVKNISSLPPARTADVRRALESELRRNRVTLVEPEQAVEELRVTLSENVQGYLWIAEIGHYDSWDVVMLAVPFLAPPDKAPSILSLRRNLVWVQPEPILDVSAAADGTQVVLGASAISLVRLQDGKREPVTNTPLVPSRPWPRDLRGRLLLQPDSSFRAYLPGAQCTVSMQPQLAAICRASDDPWPLSAEVNAFFSARRNFFTGAVKLSQTNQPGDLGPFYSAAIYPQGDRGFWVVAFTSGEAQLLNSRGETVSRFASWGSDVASLSSNCGSGWQVLATRASDRGSADSLQAYEIVNREAVEAGTALEFAGPVTALWSAPDEHSVLAVSHNLKTGNYEAFSISAVCGR